MRATRIAGAAAAVLLAVVGPAASASATADAPGFPDPHTPPQAGWFPVPTQPFDIAAGVLCDAALHLEFPVDEVVERILTTYPDGSEKLVQFAGPLIVRVFNKDTGEFTDVDASGSANRIAHEDGSQTWDVLGPALFGFRDGHGNMPRGAYRLDGVYQVNITPTGDRFLTMVRGTQVNVCTLIE